jgi:hypothetical protein
MTTKKDRTVQMTDGKWYKLGYFDGHVCCSCGAEHKVDVKLEKGVLWERWTVTKKGTVEHLKSYLNPPTTE